MRFKTSIKDSSLLLDDITLTHDCSVDIEGGKLENLRYRVIALDNPFPNHDSGRYPKLNGYASNWYGLWSDTYKFNTVTEEDVKSFNIKTDIKDDIWTVDYTIPFEFIKK